MVQSALLAMDVHVATNAKRSALLPPTHRLSCKKETTGTVLGQMCTNGPFLLLTSETTAKPNAVQWGKHSTTPIGCCLGPAEIITIKTKPQKQNTSGDPIPRKGQETLESGLKRS